MNSTAILFAHHKWDSQSVKNFASFAKHNPDCDIIPLSFKNTNAKRHFGLASRDEYATCDALVYTWFMEMNPKYDRYIFMESDAFCTQPLREFYSRVWHCDFACAEYKTPDEHDNNAESFGDRGLKEALGAEVYLKLYPSLRAVVPCCGFLASHAALKRIVAEALDPRLQLAFSEIRLGTAVNLAGLKPEIIRHDISKFIAWKHIVPNGKGVFHKFASRKKTALWHFCKSVRLTFGMPK